MKAPAACVFLAAGDGTRMHSRLPKVLHKMAGFPLLAHGLRAAQAAGIHDMALVLAPGAEAVEQAARAHVPHVQVFTQDERRGTAHAARQAAPFLKSCTGPLIIAFGDTPLLRASTFESVLAGLENADLVIGAFHAFNPHGYGRLIVEGDRLVAIREEKEASADEKHITLVNGGLMGFRGAPALALLQAVEANNTAGEYYLTAVVALAAAQGLRVQAVTLEAEDVMGVNTRAQLAEAEALAQRRLRQACLNQGVTLIAPETVMLAADTELASDVVVHPYVVFGPGVSVESGAEIFSFSHLEGVHVGANARIGPYARLRPGSRIGAEAHVGNFVEVNRSALADNVCANHLAYLGDTTVGAGTNIGAGTITCNFDGADKFPTTIGRDVFVGSNVTLVAPLAIGDEVLVAAGSTLTQDVPPQSLVFGRMKGQHVVPERGGEKVRAKAQRRAARKARKT